MKEKKVLFMGTTSFSKEILSVLDDNFNVVGVVCQPDKKIGRKMNVYSSCPVKEYAIENNLKLFQEENIKKSYKKVLEVNPDIIVTCAYGQMLNEELINFPKYQTVNVHASLLPKLRGGAPIERAIMAGDDKTGITIMYTDKKMDSGDIICQEEVLIDKTDNYETLKNKLIPVAKHLIVSALNDIFLGKSERIKQDDSKKTYAPIITKDDEHISFNDTTVNIYNKIRALNPTPGCYIFLNGQRIKLISCIVGENSCDICGKIIKIYKDGIGISTKDGEIIVKELQVAGKNKMFVKDYLNGVNKENILNKIVE